MMNEVTIMTALTHGELTDQTCQKMTLAKQYLDEHCSLDQGSHTQVTHYLVYYNHLMAFFADGSHCGLKQPKQFVALCGHRDDPTAILLKKKDELHIELSFNRRGDTGQIDIAHIDDIQMETQLSAVESNKEATQLKRLWISFLTGIEYSIVRDRQSKTYTAKDGSEYLL